MDNYEIFFQINAVSDGLCACRTYCHRNNLAAALLSLLQGCLSQLQLLLGALNNSQICLSHVAIS